MNTMTLARRPQAAKLDALDVEMLRLLETDGRISKVALADKLKLSPSSAFERMKRLEKEGVILAYRALIDRARLRRLLPIWVEVTLRRHHASDFALFERTIQTVPEITYCVALGGGIDYLIRVETTDIDSYQALIDRLLEMGIGIDRYFTYIVTKAVKDRPGPLLPD